MSEYRFQKGDLVKLKSGGPAMTVDHTPAEARKYGGTPYYRCVWFRGASQDSGLFEEHLLEDYEPPKK